MEELNGLLLQHYGPAAFVCLFLYWLREDVKELKEEIKPVPAALARLDELERRMNHFDERFNI